MKNENRVQDSVVLGNSIQIGEVHGDIVYSEDREVSPVLGLVREVDPVRLGVHRPIRVGADDAMPTYVPRDVDGELRHLVRRAATDGGFVLVIGGSSVGKTRSLFEAVRDTVPDWPLAQPANRQQWRSLERSVIWLDEFQNYLGMERGLTAEYVRQALGRQLMVVATLWPQYYDLYSVPCPEDVENDRYTVERELLKLASIVHLRSSFSPAERERATGAAETDGRLQIALSAEDFVARYA